MAAIRYETVPEHWKGPFGPYREAPAEFGGGWYVVTPFTGPEPWRTQGPKPDAPPLPPGFEAIFGKEPTSADFQGAPNPSLAARMARDLWLQDLKYFKQAGRPEWMDDTQQANVDSTFTAWGLGVAMFYEGRYGWMGRFPGSQIRDFEAPAWSCVFGAHQLIAGYQMRLIEMGIIPEKRHPFVPPHLWPGGDENS